MSQTHFGYQQVPEEHKAHKVAEVFHSVAAKYDVMNDLMSAGLHRLWKAFTITQAGIRPGYKVLDIAAGTGDGDEGSFQEHDGSWIGLYGFVGTRACGCSGIRRPHALGREDAFERALQGERGGDAPSGNRRGQDQRTFFRSGSARMDDDGAS